MDQKKQKINIELNENNRSKASNPKDALPWLNKSVFIIIGLVFLSAVVLVWLLKHETRRGPSIAPVNSDLLPGMQLSDAPWQPEFSRLRERLDLIGLPALNEEGSALHIHQHLDVVIHGKLVPVPAAIGFNALERFISPIHTHDANGVIHIESPNIQKYTLGQFLDIWGVRFSSNCISSYCADPQNFLKTFINGQPMVGDPRLIELTDHQVIVITYGTPGELPNPVPSQFQFPPGS
ncbi:MAG: hypothetical protein HY200_03095 [Nitrospirae bacterium]|nr:hypothetical protein [Nitrospirota bacterium]MBI3593919.1 hypothetical protein [Nitrospirota bacterium]